LRLRSIQSRGESSGATALGALRREPFDAVILDLCLGNESGLDILKAIKAEQADLPVIMISGHGDIACAIDAIRQGAMDFLEKPVDQQRLEALLASLGNRLGLIERVRAHEESWLSEHVAGRDSAPMRAALELARKAGKTRLSVLLEGPSGCGKELFAKYIQTVSDRSGAPFVSINCAALPRELFESALFGARKGSYTGAVADRAGYLEEADGGTVFLDEVGELPLELQPKLLRALEYGEIQPLGFPSVKRVDLRFVAATNRDLLAAVRNGSFREDLYYRMAQVCLRVPPLAERREDIPLIAEQLIKRLSEGGPARRFSPEALSLLQNAPFPGNVRELKNLVERAYFLSSADIIGTGELSPLLGARQGLERGAQGDPQVDARENARENALVTAGEIELGPFTRGELKSARLDFERRYIAAVLERNENSVNRAAAELGLLPNNLSREMKRLGMRRNGEEA
jgi:two-component system NtrC family response regulator